MYGLTFSPDVTRLRSCSEDGRVFTWDAVTGKTLATTTFKLDTGNSWQSGAIAGERVLWVQYAVERRAFPGAYWATTAELGSGKEVSRFGFSAWNADFNVI